MKNENKKMNMIERMMSKMISNLFDIDKLIKNQIEYVVNETNIESSIDVKIENIINEFDINELIENQIEYVINQHDVQSLIDTQIENMLNDVNDVELITQHIKNEIDIDELIKNVIRENEIKKQLLIDQKIIDNTQSNIDNA